jgi:hypothetical protein
LEGLTDRFWWLIRAVLVEEKRKYIMRLLSLNVLTKGIVKHAMITYPEKSIVNYVAKKCYSKITSNICGNSILSIIIGILYNSGDTT